MEKKRTAPRVAIIQPGISPFPSQPGFCTAAADTQQANCEIFFSKKIYNQNILRIRNELKYYNECYAQDTSYRKQVLGVEHNSLGTRCRLCWWLLHSWCVLYVTKTKTSIGIHFLFTFRLLDFVSQLIFPSFLWTWNEKLKLLLFIV